MEFFNLNFCLKIENIFICNVFQLTINFFIMFSIPPAYSAHFSQWSQYKKLHFNDGLCINKIAMNEKILHHKYFIAVYNSRIKHFFFCCISENCFSPLLLLLFITSIFHAPQTLPFTVERIFMFIDQQVMKFKIATKLPLERS